MEYKPKTRSKWSLFRKKDDYGLQEDENKRQKVGRIYIRGAMEVLGDILFF